MVRESKVLMQSSIIVPIHERSWVGEHCLDAPLSYGPPTTHIMAQLNLHRVEFGSSCRDRHYTQLVATYEPLKFREYAP